MNKKKNLTTEEIFSLAEQNHKKKNLQVAENLYKEILKTNPDHVNVHNNLGLVFKELGELQKAVDCYQRIIQIQSENAYAHYNLGIIFKELGELQKAVDCYQKVIQINPDRVEDAHLNLGLVFKELREYQKAIICYQKAIQINPNYAGAYNNLGNIQRELGEHKKAMSSFEKTIQIQPNYANAHYNLGVTLQELGEHQKAMSSYQMAAKYEPENLAHLYHLSRLDEKILHSNLKKKIYEIIEKNNSTKKNIAYGNFLLSRYELKAKKYKNEFDHLLKGHQYYFESENKKFIKNIEYWLNELPKKKKLINFNRRNENIKKDNYVIKPIFIIGVPRCGSTLIEKVIASGSQYIPIGEETFIIDTVVTNLINHRQSLNAGIENFQTKIVETYKQKGLVQEKSDYMFTDKSLENFFYIDIIKEIFPQAKVINCRRNALSSIMSTLKK